MGSRGLVVVGDVWDWGLCPVTPLAALGDFTGFVQSCRATRGLQGAGRSMILTFHMKGLEILLLIGIIT